MMERDRLRLLTSKRAGEDCLSISSKNTLASGKSYLNACLEYGLIKAMEVVGYHIGDIIPQLEWAVPRLNWGYFSGQGYGYVHEDIDLRLDEIIEEIKRDYPDIVKHVGQELVLVKEEKHPILPNKNFTDIEVKFKIKNIVRWSTWTLHVVETLPPTSIQMIDLHRLAVAKCLQSVGENLNKLSDETLAAMSEGCDAVGLIGLRNIIAHQYENIDWQKVDRIVEVDIPELIETIENYIAV